MYQAKKDLVLQSEMGITPTASMPRELLELLSHASSVETHTLKTHDWSFGPTGSINGHGISFGLQITKSNHEEKYLKITK